MGPHGAPKAEQVWLWPELEGALVTGTFLAECPLPSDLRVAVDSLGPPELGTKWPAPPFFMPHPMCVCFPNLLPGPQFELWAVMTVISQ